MCPIDLFFLSILISLVTFLYPEYILTILIQERIKKETSKIFNTKIDFWENLYLRRTTMSTIPKKRESKLITFSFSEGIRTSSVENERKPVSEP